MAVVLERQPLGDQQVPVGGEAQRDVGVGDVGAAGRRRGGDRQQGRDRGEQPERQPAGDHAGPGERETSGVASAAAGASKNSRR